MKKAAEMSVVSAVKRDLADLEKQDPKLAQSALAASALALAREMDDDNSATSKSMCAKSLMETMSALRAQAPPAQTKDRLDELAARRSQRITAAQS